MKKLIILGESWTLDYHTYAEDKRLTDCDGYCDWTTRTIIVEKEGEGTLGDMAAYMNKVARHEIIHAYLMECGLAESSLSAEAWAVNEEMVDWFARLGPQIVRTWNEAGVASR